MNIGLEPGFPVALDDSGDAVIAQRYSQTSCSWSFQRCAGEFSYWGRMTGLLVSEAELVR